VHLLITFILSLVQAGTGNFGTVGIILLDTKRTTIRIFENLPLLSSRACNAGDGIKASL
jgi:hypothetical protein